MNLGDLLKLIIPALFLVIWAVNQLLGKEEVTAPPRGQPIGPRPGGLPPAPRPPASASQQVPQGSAQPASPAQPPRPKPASFANPEEIFVIRADAEPNPRPAPRPAPAPARRQPRPKPSKRAPEPTAPKWLTPLPTSLETTPLSVQAPSAGPATSLTTAVHPLAELVRSPDRLREALILNEVLGPPRALRGPRR